MRIYSCEFCNYETNRPSHWKRHINSNKHKTRCYEKDNNFDEMKIEMEKHIKKELKNKEIEKKLRIIKKQMNKKENNYKKIIDEIINQKDKQFNQLLDKLANSNKTINNNQNVFNYIVNNVKPTTNVDIEMDKPLTEKEIKLIQEHSVVEGSYLYIHGRFIDGRNNSERLIVCCDIARKKFSYFNKDNKWIVDIKLKKFFEKVFEKIVNVHTGTIEYDEKKYSVVEFTDFVGKKIEKYDKFKKLLKNNQNELLYKLYDDVRIDKKFIDSHKNEIE
ncbi:MAG: hypothetical protein CMF62_02170 [Magnetococcales bacterium]|nr:hypothetical protein [Magnetococcales bacterium]|tara:strand:- start:172278 stop:173102 length:825 start_codon:yes stop_codon:yes gene_type:complete